MTRAKPDAETDLAGIKERPVLGTRPTAVDPAFFASYGWCLNPLQTVRDLIERICSELDRYGGIGTPWQREELRINLYLLISAACCATDDYLVYRPWNLAPVTRRFAGIRGLVSLLEISINAPYALRNLLCRLRVRRWRVELAKCLDRICEILVNGTEQSPGSWLRLRSGVEALSGVTLPPLLLQWRARIPEAFRCQDLSHHDILALAQRFLASRNTGTGPILVVGPRTAGAYFAPLLKAFLQARQIPVTAWTTVRPKMGTSRHEKTRLRKLIASADRLLLVDDHPNTGDTFAIMVALLERLGARRESIIILAPDHPAQLNWAQRLHPTVTITLPFDEIYKRKLLCDKAAMASILRQLFYDLSWDDLQLQESPRVDALNSRLSAHFPDSFEVRSKRVFEVRLVAHDRPPAVKHVLAKSVGWGWLGYHAYIAAHHLADFVPRVVGLRQGLLFTEWIGALEPGVSTPSVRSVLTTLPFYIAARVEKLPLSEDPCFTNIGYRQTGWGTLVRMLCRPYGRTVGVLKTKTLKAELKRYISPHPTLLDGGLSRENWVKDKSGIYKVDFEHHNFGGAQQDMVDPCYDLACAIFEFDLSETDERQLVDTYVRESGDASAHGRLLLFKLVCGVVAMQTAAYCIVRSASRARQEDWNRRYNAARNYLTIQMSRYAARGLGVPSSVKWTQKLFFLDVDGVFDSEFFGPFFQHTTPSGILALGILKLHGYSVVLNTGRSIEHVRSYCRTYRLPGGVAEYGSVFVDAVRNIELPMVDDQGQKQLARCRDLIQKMPGVFIDSGYRWSLRCYRYDGTTTIGLQEAELRELLNRCRFDRLKFIARDVDSYIIQNNLDKGSALEMVKKSVSSVESPIVAIGDSVHDVEMLRRADVAYVPANFPKAQRELLSTANYHAMPGFQQKGLLAAARHLTGGHCDNSGSYSAAKSGIDDCSRLIDSILRAAERPKLVRLLGLFDPHKF
jgi:hypothetical protein